jgi:hypothetical protein
MMGGSRHRVLDIWPRAILPGPFAVDRVVAGRFLHFRTAREEHRRMSLERELGIDRHRGGRDRCVLPLPSGVSSSMSSKPIARSRASTRSSLSLLPFPTRSGSVNLNAIGGFAANSMRSRVVGAVLVLAGACGSTAHGQIAYSETNFMSFWVDQVIAGGTPQMVGGVWSRSNYGNPSDGFNITHQINPGAPTGGYCARWVWSMVILYPHVADPTALGGISTIDFSIDSAGVWSEPLGSPMVQSQAAALKQNGRWYISTVGPGVTPAIPNWSTTAVNGLRDVDFAEVVNLPPCTFMNTASHPDFSPHGAPMELGFARGNSTGIGGNAVRTTVSSNADNWSMMVHDCGLRIYGEPRWASTCPNGPAVFSVAADAPSTSGPLSYRWEAREGSTGNWIPLVEGENPGIGEVEGTSLPDLHVIHAHGTGGTMRCVVWGPCTFIMTEPANLIICIADTDDGAGAGHCDGGVGIEDLLYYLGVYDTGTSRADVDDGSGTGQPDGGVGIEDLLYYLSRFDAGC